MTTPLSTNELKVIFNLAIAKTEGATARYVVTNPLAGWYISLTGSRLNGYSELKGKGYDGDAILALQSEVGKDGKPTAAAEQAIKLVKETSSVLAVSGFSLGLAQFDFGQRGGQQASQYGIDPPESKPGETVGQYFVRQVNAVAPADAQWTTDDLQAKLPKRIADYKANELDTLEDQVIASNNWLQTNAGRAFVDKLDNGLAALTSAKVQPILDTLAIRRWSESDLVVAAAGLEKTYNQSPSNFGKQVIFLTSTEKASLGSFTSFTNDLQKTNAALATDKAVAAAEVLSALKSSTSFFGLYNQVVARASVTLTQFPYHS